MFRLEVTVRLSGFVLVAGLVVLAGSPARAQAPAASAGPAMATPADAAPFIGDWVITAEGPMGPSVFRISVAVVDGAVTARVGSDFMDQAVTNIRKNGEALVLIYSFDFDGNPVPAVVTLARAEDLMGAVIDFGGGAFVMQGAGPRAPAEASAESPEGQPAAAPE